MIEMVEILEREAKQVEQRLLEEVKEAETTQMGGLDGFCSPFFIVNPSS